MKTKSPCDGEYFFFVIYVHSIYIYFLFSSFEIGQACESSETHEANLCFFFNGHSFSTTNSAQSAVHLLPRTRAHRWPRLVSVAWINRGEENTPSFPPREHGISGVSNTPISMIALPCHSGWILNLGNKFKCISCLAVSVQSAEEWFNFLLYPLEKKAVCCCTNTKTTKTNEMKMIFLLLLLKLLTLHAFMLYLQL